MFRNCLREPFVHFILVGALLFTIYGLTAKQGHLENGAYIQITAEQLNNLREQWLRQNGNEVDSETFDDLVESLIRQEILLREAKRLGLDENDTIVRRRLIQKMEFLSVNPSQIQIPEEATILKYYTSHRDQYRIAEKRSFSHIYFSKELRGATALDDAKADLEKLLEKSAPVRIEDWGDNFILQYSYKNRTQQQIANIFGAGFAQALFKMKTEQWQGPLSSEYGAHLLKIEHIGKSTIPEFADIKAKVKDDVISKQLKEFKEESYIKLRTRYQVAIENMTDMHSN